MTKHTGDDNQISFEIENLETQSTYIVYMINTRTVAAGGRRLIRCCRVVLFLSSAPAETCWRDYKYYHLFNIEKESETIQTLKGNSSAEEGKKIANFVSAMSLNYRK